MKSVRSALINGTLMAPLTAPPAKTKPGTKTSLQRFLLMTTLTGHAAPS